VVEASWNVTAPTQKPDFVFRRNGRDHLNWRGCQFSRLLAAEVCASALIVGSNAGYTMFRGSEKGTGYSLHSPVSPSLPLLCVTMCHHVSTGVYHHNLWMPLQCRLSETGNISAKINTPSFSCTRQWTAQDQQAMWQHVQCAWFLGNHSNQHHLNLGIYFFAKNSLYWIMSQIKSFGSIYCIFNTGTTIHMWAR